MRKFVTTFLSILILASLFLASCGTPTPQTLVQTVEVEVEKTVIETKEVVVTKEVEVMVTPQAPAGPATFERSETLYVSGAAWGPASTWNPYQPGSLANTTGTIGFVYEFLYAYDPMADEMIPWLAESSNWAGPETFEVTLRSGLTWSDGQPLTAADVKYTFDLGDQYPALWFAPVWNYLTGVEAAGDNQVIFTFDDPLYQEFSYFLYNVPIVPQHLWQDKSEEEITIGANENPIGSGAYMYESHADDRNVWVRNENWWGIPVFGKPAPARIVDIRTSSNNVALGMVVKGELDLSNNFLPGVAELSNKGYVQTYYASAPYMLPANTAVLFLNTANKPMDDAAFRKALAFSIDVPSIVNVAYAQLVAAASPTGLLPSLEKYIDQSVVDELGYTYDTAQAKKLLAAAGYTDVDGDGFVEAPDGSKVELRVTCPSGWTDWMAAIDIIAKSAQAAGINIQAETPDYGAWNTELQSGTFDMTLNNWATTSNTPWTLYNLLFNHPIREQMQNGNFGRYDSQEMFDLVDALARVPTTDEDGMKAACSDIQELMLEEVPVIPLWYNGLWSQWSNAAWTNWPTETASNQTMPSTWSGYWQLGGLETLINLELAE